MPTNEEVQRAIRELEGFPGDSIDDRSRYVAAAQFIIGFVRELEAKCAESELVAADQSRLLGYDTPMWIEYREKWPKGD